MHFLILGDTAMDYAQQLAFFANILEQKRLVTTLEGNASIIDRATGLTYITPSGRMKLLLQREDISVMDESGAQIGGRGKRSSEYLLHEAVYRARPDVNAVVHCHCPYLTAYALRYRDFIVPEDCSLHVVFQRFVCLPYGKNGTHEIHKGIEAALAHSPLCLLGGHGVVCVSASMESCIGLLEAAEGLAKTLWIAGQI
jgi:L-ribulose-5-phosphate 4-epimerase